MARTAGATTLPAVTASKRKEQTVNTVNAQAAETPIEISACGPVGRRARERLRAELADLAAESPRQPLFLRGRLCVQRNPSIQRPVTVSGTILLRGRLVRARASGSGTLEATDLLAHRMRRRLRDVHDRDVSHRDKTSRRRRTRNGQRTIGTVIAK
jgi:hypothetical protein